MSYPILSPTHKDEALASKCALAVMAKAPRPGRVKTRLSPPLTPEQAAAINVCFLRDTTQNIADVTITGESRGVISYTPVGDEHLFDSLLPDGFSLIAQRGDGFGERLLTSAEDLLSCGFDSVCLIDSDSPTVPASFYRFAVEALRKPGDRIILGGSEDGGYYLIGLKFPHPEPFKDIHWSTSTVYEETVSAIQRAKIELVELPVWYDVDDGATLSLLREELVDGNKLPFAKTSGYCAPFTWEFLSNLSGVGK